MKPEDRKPYAPGGAGRNSSRGSGPQGSDRRRNAGPQTDRYVPSRSAKRLLNDVMDVSHADERPQRAYRDDRPERSDHEPEGLDRLHKYLARCGIASRRSAEAIIAEGRVEVNGEIVQEMGIKVYPGRDRILVDGVPCRPEKLHYVLLFKPKGVLTTLSDPKRRPTIMKYLPDLGVMLRPVGRLDMDSEGILICTNDGNLTDRLTHPKFGVEKEYEVIVKGDVDEKSLTKLREGVFVHGRWTAEAFVEKVSYERRLDTTKLRMIIHEGRNRQIRLMCESVGHPVEELERVRIGNLTTKGMRRGEARIITVMERETLWASSGPKAEVAWLEERLGRKRPALRNDRPEYDRGDRPREDRGDRPSGGGNRYGGNRPDGNRYEGNRDNRSSDGGNRYEGNRDSRPSGGNRYEGNRDSRPYNDRYQGNRDDRPSGGNRYEGNRDNRPSDGNRYDDNRDRPSGGNRYEGNRDNRPSGGNRYEGNRDNRPSGGNRYEGNRDNRPSGGNRYEGNRDNRASGGNRYEGNRESRPYNDRYQGNRDDRPRDQDSRPNDSAGQAPDSGTPRPKPYGRRPSGPQNGGYEVRDKFAPKPKINTGGRGYMRKPGGPGGNRGRFQGDQKRNSGQSNRPPKPKSAD